MDPGRATDADLDSGSEQVTSANAAEEGGAGKDRTGATSTTRVAAVLVSYNRRQLLQRCLEAIVHADVIPQVLVVVDNGSTDGSVEYLRSLQRSGSLPQGLDYELVTLPVNTGGAGGFAVGMAHALAHHDPELLWVMDDDTQAHPDTLREAVALREAAPVAAPPALIASTVVWSDGREHPMNNPRTRFGASRSSLRRWAGVHARPVRSASFVSLFIDAQVLRSEGLPLADYFLWNDDFEFSTRLARRHVAVSSAKSQVTHHTGVFDSYTTDVGERFFFEVRNKLWMFGYSASLSGWEKLLYGISSVRRWALMVARSKRKAVIARAGLAGLRAALAAGPRSNTAVLDRVHELPDWQLPGVPADADGRFSVLLPVYCGDGAGYFRRAVESVSVQQSRKPAEIVVVQDGAVPGDLAEQIARAEQIAQVPVKLVRLPQQCGLAAALDAGLAECSYEFIARMDADDVSEPDRFATELPYLQAGFSVVGSAINEIGEDEHDVLAYRPVTEEPGRLARNSAFRSPFHHPSVMLRKSSVIAVGGYGSLDKMEDFWLWLRLLKSGYRGVNLPAPLLKYRVNAGAYQRRGGPKLLKAELHLQGRALRSGYITPAQWLRNVLVRAVYRVVPTRARQRGYRAAFTRSE